MCIFSVFAEMRTRQGETMTTYFELINQTLTELSYRTVSDFSQLVKPDHERIKMIVNRVNNIVLDSYDWDFLKRSKTVTLTANNDRAELPDDLKINHVIDDRGSVYVFTDEYMRILNGRSFNGQYTVFDGKIIVRPQDYDRVFTICHITKNHAKTAGGTEKFNLETGTDETLLPPEYAPIIVFGACMQFKSNPEHPRYKYWLKQYTDTRAAMRAAHSTPPPQPPKFVLPDWTVGIDRYRQKMGW